MQKIIFLLLILPVMIIPVAYADSHNIPTESESRCGPGTFYDAPTDSCLLDTNNITDTESLCGPGIYYNSTTNSCVSDTVSIPELEPQTNSTSPSSKAVNDIPAWVQSIFAWYGEGKITDSELLDAIRFLVNNGIIVL